MELILKSSRSASHALCLYDDFDDPVISRFKWYLALVSPAKKPYAFTRIGKQTFSMHRLVLSPIDKGLWVDHINGNGLDNRRENLRVCTPSQNLQNTSGWVKRKCAYKGVTKISRWRSVRITTPIWEARICVDRKQRVVGTFYTPKEAALAYDSQARLLHGKFARLNFPHPGEMGLNP